MKSAGRRDAVNNENNNYFQIDPSNTHKNTAYLDLGPEFPEDFLDTSPPLSKPIFKEPVPVIYAEPSLSVPIVKKDNVGCTRGRASLGSPPNDERSQERESMGRLTLTQGQVHHNHHSDSSKARSSVLMVPHKIFLSDAGDFASLNPSEEPRFPEPPNHWEFEERELLDSPANLGRDNHYQYDHHGPLAPMVKHQLSNEDPQGMIYQSAFSDISTSSSTFVAPVFSPAQRFDYIPSNSGKLKKLSKMENVLGYPLIVPHYRFEDRNKENQSTSVYGDPNNGYRQVPFEFSDQRGMLYESFLPPIRPSSSTKSSAPSTPEPPVLAPSCRSAPLQKSSDVLESTATKKPRKSRSTKKSVDQLLAEVEEDTYIDTEDLCQKIKRELKKHRIHQHIFSKKVLNRGQGTLSDLIHNPKPWKKLKNGKETYRLMYDWLHKPLEERLAILDAEDSNSGNSSPTLIQNGRKLSETPTDHEEPKPKKTRLVFTDHQRKILQRSFEIRNRPTPEMEKILAEMLELDFSTVTNFFNNARRRSRHGVDDFVNATLDEQENEIELSN